MVVLLRNSCCCRTRVVRRTRALLPATSSANTALSPVGALRISPRQHEALRWGFRVQTLTCGDRPLDARALRYRGGAQMSAPPSEPALSALPPSAQPSSVPPSGPLRPLSHTEPHTPSHTTTATRFSCCRCGFESHVDYHGRTPPFNRSVVFLEAVYLIRSPMGDANRPLCLGGTCVVWCATT